MIVFLVLLAVIAPLVIVTPLQDEWVLPKLVTTATFTGGALIWGSVLLARDRWPAGRWPRAVTVALVAFVAANVLATVFALDWRWSIVGEHLRYQGLATTLLYVLLFAVTATAVRTTRDLRWLLLALFAGALGTAIYALMQKAGWAWWPANLPDRPASTLGQANALGAFLVAAITSSSFLALTAKARWQQAALGAGLLTMIAALAVTVSQSAYLALAGVWLLAGGALQIWYVPRPEKPTLRRVVRALAAIAAVTPFVISPVLVRVYGWDPSSALLYLAFAATVLFAGLAADLWLIPKLDAGRLRVAFRVTAASLFVAPILLALIFVLVVGLPGRESVLAATDNEAVQGRPALWRMGLEMTADRPLLGHGQDAFTLLFASYRDQPDLPGINTNHIQPESSHNFFVDLLSGTGILGLLSFLALVGAVLGCAARPAASTGDRQLRLALLAVGGGVVGYLAAIFFGFSEAMTSWVLWLLLGAATGLVIGVAPRRDGDPSHSPAHALASGLGAVCLALVGMLALGWAATLTAADLSAAQAESASRRGDHAAAARLANRAFTLNPLRKEYLVQEAQAYQNGAYGLSDPSEGLERAIELYEKLFDRFEEQSFDVWRFATARHSLAQMPDSQLDLEDVIPDLERAIELDAFNAVMRRQLIQLYESDGLQERADAHLFVIYCWTQCK